MPPDTIAVLAEKPAVARDIARVLGASQREEGCLRGNGYVVTWAIGHLVELAQPHEINPDWKRWRRDHLPMLPRDWPLVVSEETKAQFEAVRRVINAPEVERVVCATDAGREGELIFRHIYEAAGGRRCSPPQYRGRGGAKSRSSGSGSPRSPPTPSARGSASCATAATSIR